MEKNKSLIDHFLVVGFGAFLNLVIGILTTPLITRMVGTEEYGQYSVFSMYSSIALMVLCMGFDQALIRFFYYEDSEDYQRTLLMECWKLPMGACVILGIAINILCYSGIIQMEFDNFVVTMLTVCITFQVLNRLDLVLLRVSYKTKLYSFLQVMYKLLFAGFVLGGCLVLNSNQFYIMVIATTASYIIVTLIGITSQKEIWKFWNISNKYKINRKNIYVYSFPFIISMGITTFFQAIDKISLNIYCTYSEVGIYSSAMTLVHIFSIVQTTFNSLWAPMVTKHFEKDPEDKAFYMQGNRIITLVMFFMGFSVILLKDVLAFLLGKDFREAANILPFLIFNPVMLTISETTVIGIVFMKKSSMHIIIAAISCVVNIIGNILLVPIYGCRGAAISTGLSYIVFFWSRTLIANQFYFVRWKLLRFWIVTIIAMIYAVYNTFIDFGIFSIIGYFLSVGVLLFLYRDALLEGWIILKKQIISMKK